MAMAGSHGAAGTKLNKGLEKSAQQAMQNLDKACKTDRTRI
jgi:hypothetical protein